MFSQVVAQQQASGNMVTEVSVTLGFNDLAALAPMQNAPSAKAAWDVATKLEREEWGDNAARAAQRLLRG